MPSKRFDVIIIGSGIVGLSSAYHIKNNNPDVRIAVVDMAPTFAQGNTGKSAAGFRDLFSSEVNFKLSHSSIEFYKHIQEDLKFDLGMKFIGYLFLLNNSDIRLDVLETLSRKTKVKHIDSGSLSDLGYLRLKLDPENKKLLNLSDIDVGILGENCGIIEPELVAEFYYQELVKMGVEFFFNTKVEQYKLEPVNPLDYPGEPFLWQKTHLKSIMTNNGPMEADVFISATDVWTTGLLDSTGIDSHIRPKKRQIFQIGGPEVEKILFGWEQNEGSIMPFTILPSYGVYLRPAPKYKAFWVGSSDDYGRDYSLEVDPEAERSFYENSVSQIFQAYFPSFSNSKLTGMWAGYYAYNTIDGTPYIFKDLNIIVATGTSGSGILKGDAIGRIVEGIYSNRENTTLFGGLKIKTSALSVSKREVDREEFVI